MKLYHWKSVALEQFDEGDIIVMANGLTEAKKKAKKRLIEMLQEERELSFLDDSEQCEKDDIKCAMQFDLDLAKEPVVLESGVLLLYGYI